jgi:hypothetical protein
VVPREPEHDTGRDPGRDPQPELPLDALRAAWRGAQPRAPGGPLEHEDEATRRAVAWLREAWSSLEAPPATRATRRATPSRRRRVAAWSATLTLAAAVLVAVSVALWMRGEDPAGAAPDVAAVDPPPGAADPPGPGDAGDSAPPPVRPPEPAPVVEAVGDGRLVLRSGPVRLFLATGGGRRATDDPAPTEISR